MVAVNHNRAMKKTKDSPELSTNRRRPTLVVTKYMGSKKAILDFVVDELERLTSPGDILVDLMAGTHTIGYAMKSRCQIIANDIQRFSGVIGYTLLNYVPTSRFEGKVRDNFRRYYVANLRHLEGLFSAGLQRERMFLNPNNPKPPDWASYRNFCESYPHFLRPVQSPEWPEEFLLLFSKARVRAYRALNKLEPYNLFSLYFASNYVGVRQAAQIDSIRCAIDKLCDEYLVNTKDEHSFDNYGLRNLLLAALISAINRINPAPGHWAAIPRVNKNNRDYLIECRRLDVYDIFLAKVAEFEAALAQNISPYAPNHVIMTEDYAAFMGEVQEYIRQAKVVYLDPPYSQGHYSRFYHLLETLIQYDYPEIAFAGRYRTDRHQSPFAKRDKVAEAIGNVCRMVRDSKTILVVSYSQGGVIPNVAEFQQVLEQFYPTDKIELHRLVSAHSMFGQAKRMATEEYIFTCHP